MTRVGTVESLRSWPTCQRASPARITPASSTRMGVVKSNLTMLCFSLKSCLGLWRRGLLGHGLRAEGGWSTMPLSVGFLVGPGPLEIGFFIGFPSESVEVDVQK